MELISIIMPVYNGAQYLRESIGSVIAQSYQNWELICVNDSSTDNSLEILNEIAANDRRVKVHTKANEKFGNRATKYGIERANGDYLIYISQDDLFSIDLLLKNIDCINVNGVDAVVPQMKYYDFATKQTSDFIMHITSNVISGIDAFNLSLNWGIHGFAMWRMETVKKIGWGTDNLNDDEFTTRMLYYNMDKVAFSGGIFYYHNQNPNAITAKWSDNQLDYLDTDAKLYKFIVDNITDKTALKIVCNNTKNDLYRAIIMFGNATKQIKSNDRHKVRQLIKGAFVKHHYIIRGADLSLKDKVVFSNRHLFGIVLFFKFIKCRF